MFFLQPFFFQKLYASVFLILRSIFQSSRFFFLLSLLISFFSQYINARVFGMFSLLLYNWLHIQNKLNKNASPAGPLRGFIGFLSTLLSRSYWFLSTLLSRSYWYLQSKFFGKKNRLRRLFRRVDTVLGVQPNFKTYSFLWYSFCGIFLKSICF